jgi:transcription elongation factor Elf1
LVAQKVLSLPSKIGLEIDKIENVTSCNNRNAISFDGECIKCGKTQHFNNIKLFVSNNYVTCSNCAQKLYIKFPKDLEQIFIENLKKHLDKNSKVGLWGVTRSTLPLFENNDAFKNEKIVFIDSSEIKQLIKIQDKKVYSPDKLLSGEIDTVIFFYQRVHAATAEEVKRKYPKVKFFINVYDLLVKSKKYETIKIKEKV